VSILIGVRPHDNRAFAAKLHEGDALQRLKELRSASINCVITSPPYFGVRDYEASGQLGQEQTPEEYISKLVAVFREVAGS
jgi:DNA modification methylase